MFKVFFLHLRHWLPVGGWMASRAGGLQARDLERFTEQLLVHTAKDIGFFKAAEQQIKGNATETLVAKKKPILL
jgi:hypothetical protein